MRLAKTNRLVILAGVLAIILAALAWLQSGQEEIKQSLLPEMELAAKRLANLNLSVLEERIVVLTETEAQASANATAIREHFAGRYEGLDVGETLYQIARENRVNLYMIDSAGLASIDDEGISGTNLPMSLTVRGEVLNILNFIERLHETYPLGQVSTVTINNTPHGIVREATEAAYVDAEIYEAAEAVLQLVIRNYTVSDDSG
jgi:hypothetical protein